MNRAARGRFVRSVLLVINLIVAVAWPPTVLVLLRTVVERPTSVPGGQYVAALILAWIASAIVMSAWVPQRAPSLLFWGSSILSLTVWFARYIGGLRGGGSLLVGLDTTVFLTVFFAYAGYRFETNGGLWEKKWNSLPRAKYSENEGIESE